ncbi:hypothetical protein T10_13150 [Trichinella papuae]|uniref:Uncharacterized protein n=1 Tax=Trichinella papuae TaxID=268474 RepID=A0A0V1MAY1_9BILA|nr:hypothetical protein T10_13150 [Trichinella papuae]
MGTSTFGSLSTAIRREVPPRAMTEPDFIEKATDLGYTQRRISDRSSSYQATCYLYRHAFPLFPYNHARTVWKRLRMLRIQCYS